MTIDATGTVRTGPTGQELVIERTFRASAAEVWASIIEPERMERWLGTWSGEAGVGQTVTFTMSAEEGAEPSPVTILECDEPHRLLVDLSGSTPRWRVGFDLVEVDGTTTMTFVQALVEGIDVADVGPGWEFYLDHLVAVWTDAPFTPWDDYYPHQRAHYQAQQARP